MKRLNKTLTIKKAIQIILHSFLITELIFSECANKCQIILVRLLFSLRISFRP